MVTQIYRKKIPFLHVLSAITRITPLSKYWLVSIPRVELFLSVMSMKVPYQTDRSQKTQVFWIILKMEMWSVLIEVLEVEFQTCL